MKCDFQRISKRKITRTSTTAVTVANDLSYFICENIGNNLGSKANCFVTLLQQGKLLLQQFEFPYTMGAHLWSRKPNVFV